MILIKGLMLSAGSILLLLFQQDLSHSRYLQPLAFHGELDGLGSCPDDPIVSWDRFSCYNCSNGKWKRRRGSGKARWRGHTREDGEKVGSDEEIAIY